MVARVGYEKVARAVGSHPQRVVESRNSPRAVAAARHSRGPCERGDRARGDIDLSNRVVAIVGNEKRARTVRSHITRLKKSGGRSCAVAATRRSWGTSKRGDHACGDSDLSNRVVVRVGDEEVARTVADHTFRIVKSSAGPLAILLPRSAQLTCDELERCNLATRCISNIGATICAEVARGILTAVTPTIDPEVAPISNVTAALLANLADVCRS